MNDIGYAILSFQEFVRHSVGGVLPPLPKAIVDTVRDDLKTNLPNISAEKHMYDPLVRLHAIPAV